MADCWSIIFKCFVVCYFFFLVVMIIGFVGFTVIKMIIQISTPGTGSNVISILYLSIITIMIGCSVCYCAKRVCASCLHKINHRGRTSTCDASIAPRSGETEMDHSQKDSAFTHIPSQLENWVLYSI